MKKQFLLLFASAAFIMSCNNKAETKDAVSTEKTESSSSTSTPADNSNVSADAAQARMEELRKLPPISNETMKSFFPEETMGMKRSGFSVHSALGYAVGTANYEKDDARYTVGIYDCVGEAGASFYSLSYLSRMNIETEDDNGYQKTVNYKGDKAYETYSKGSNEHSLHFVSGNRFWVTVEGNEGLDKLKSFADALGLDKLKDAK